MKLIQYDAIKFTKIKRIIIMILARDI